MEHETEPLQNGDSKEGHEVDSAVTKSDKRTWKDTCRVLTIFSLLLFLPLNIAQICVIYMYDGWELYIFAPFLVFAIGLAGVAWALRREYATFRSVFSDVLSRRWSTVKRKMKGWCLWKSWGYDDKLTCSREQSFWQVWHHYHRLFELHSPGTICQNLRRSGRKGESMGK